MINSIPVSARITIVNGKERYTNSSVRPSAPDSDLLAFARALNSLQLNRPADKFVKTVKSELAGA